MKRIMTVLLICLLVLGSVSAAFASTVALGPLESLGFMVTNTKALKTVVNADSTAGLTINGLKAGDKVEAFKLVTITTDTDGNRMYKLNTKYSEVFAKLGVNTVAALAAEPVQDVIEACQSKIGEATADLTLTAGEGATSVTKANAPMGLYFVSITSSEDATIYNPILINVPTVKADGNMTDAVATAKTYKPVPEKKIVLADGSERDDTTASVGEKVNFAVRTAVPKYTNAKDESKVKFIIKDEMQKGITYLGSPVVKGVSGTDETILADAMTESSTETTSGNTLITFTFDYSKIKSYDSILMTYSGVLNEDAAKNNFNKVTLTYTNKITTDSNGDTEYQEKTSTSDEVWVYTYDLDLTKCELGSTDIKLPGAVFSLQKGATDVYFKAADADSYITVTPGAGGYAVAAESDGTYTATLTTDEGSIAITGLTKTVTTPASGIIRMYGLGEGTYTLTEEQAPEGYYIIGNGKTTFTVTGEKGADGSYTGKVLQQNGVVSETSPYAYMVSVENSTTYTLPDTGGIGMALFLGTAVIALAAACLMLYRRLSGKR